MNTSYLRQLWERFKAGVVLSATLGPPILLGMAAHDLAATRYLERHLRDLTVTSLRPDDVVAVSGRISATPVRLAAGMPQFEGALMVTQRFERGGGFRNRWYRREVLNWVSSSAALGGWQLSSELIQKAGFEWHRVSPCADYRPPEGWAAKCPGGRYAVEQPDGRRRFSLEVTPISNETYTLVAAVTQADKTLGPIRTDLSPGAKPFAVLVKGVQDGRTILADRSKLEIGQMALWSLAIVLVATCWMWPLSTGNGIRRVWEGLSRGFVVSVPFSALYWRFESDVLAAVDLVAALAAITIASVLAWRASHPQQKGAAR